MKKLKLKPGSFNNELLKIAVPGKLGWSFENQNVLVKELVFGCLLDEDGNPIELPDKLKDRVKLVFHRSDEIQLRVLIQAYADAGYELDDASLKALTLLFDAGQFANYLATKENPKTGKPFIKKEKKGQKGKTFDALLDEEPATEEAPAPAPLKKKSPKPTEEQE